jgi:vitamin B12 transporter
MHTHVASVCSAGALAPENVAFRAKLGVVASVLLLALARFGSVAIADPAPQASPSPSPIASPVGKIPLNENPLGVITIHAGSREGYTINVAELRRLGAATVGDALRFIPGAVVQQYGPPGSLQTAALRGANASQTLVLLDGRPVNEGDTGVADFTSMPLDDLASISVTEGGLSTLYGSGAVGGVIDLVRKKGIQGHAFSASARIGYQGAGSTSISALEGTKNPGFGAWLDASMQNARNVFDYPAFRGLSGGTRVNNDARLGDSDLTLTGAHARASASLSLENNTSDLGTPGSIEFGTSAISTLARQQRVVNRSSARIGYAESGSSFTELVAYVDGRRVHFFDPTPSFPFDTLTLATARGYSLRHAMLFGRHRVELAYEGRADRALFEGTFNSPPSVVVSAASTDYYARDEYQAGDRLGIGAGVRTERNQGTKATTLPSLDVEWNFSNLHDAGLRANYSRAFRAPNLDERFFPSFGNPRLDPEYAATFDVGFFASSGTRVRNTASITFFGIDTNNLIVNQAIDTLGDFLPFNVGRSRVRGLSAQNTREFNGGWAVQASYADYFKAADLGLAPDLNGVVNYGNRLLRQPTATSSLEAWRRTGNDEYGFDVRFEGQRYGDEENKHSLPPYAALGAYVTKAAGKHLLVTVRGDNLTNQQVMDVYGYPVLPATFSVRLSTK